MSRQLVVTSRRLLRTTRGPSSLVRTFSIAVPARKEGQMQTSKPRGFLADRDTARRDPVRADEEIPAHNTATKSQLQDQIQQNRQQLDRLERQL
ncbi:uncharacterized protein BO72DRAFT_453837 [Aspergillus fijiensis CBS 313.89]|uniref:Mitochondrial ATPase inhibitor n=1 Tax=Aspergillus fijiensis CBS 313.89 TaxID=1448319 RepID=A0A8G1VSI3_9EURO|nr:uncharacterized protein BO72DRAFT_453837 [Aspergillus fijiensis CBS 313.89]RAK71295.1 hypothetical protein BO72DRAFT_453837 [Aspergillus fijiensis CBS 313.89]